MTCFNGILEYTTDNGIDGITAYLNDIRRHVNIKIRNKWEPTEKLSWKFQDTMR